MCECLENCLKHMKNKVYILISLLINLIFGFLLFLWRNDSSKTNTINAIDKVIHTFLDIVVLFKDAFRACLKKEAKEKAETLAKEKAEISAKEKAETSVKEVSLIEEGVNLAKTIFARKNIVNKLNKFIEDNVNSKDENIIRDVQRAKEILRTFKRGEQEIINNINII